MNINSILDDGYKDLINSSSKTSKLDAELLLSSVIKKNVKEIIFDRSIKATKNQLKSFRALITRRKLGEPIAYILKKKEFWKNIFYVDKNVLIPRPDTELIVEEVLKLYNANHKLSVLDIGRDQVQPLQYSPEGVSGPKIAVFIAISSPMEKVIVLPSRSKFGPISNPLYLPERFLPISTEATTSLSILASNIYPSRDDVLAFEVPIITSPCKTNICNSGIS